MKRKLLWIIPLSVLTLSSCSFFDLFNKKNNNENVDEFEAINTVLNANYKEFKVEVKTKKDDLELNSTYNIKKQNGGYLTEYSIQEYATFDLENNVIPENQIETKQGSYVTQNKEFNIQNFAISKDIFVEYTLSSNEFKASLSNGKDYLHADYNCNNFSISIKFESKLESIALSYSLDDSTQCNVSYSSFVVE